ncbi:MAG TPA: NAD-dependent epimerase/dehydratase family protein, partial [Polyangiaceae bacterium]|nr:NAD-dependent epimerase/dehydratase family protein [Polyangiaceae bacterium]
AGCSVILTAFRWVLSEWCSDGALGDPPNQRPAAGERAEKIMKAFVTGSTGLLGNNLVRTLLAEGHEVLALARSREKAQRELGDTDAQIVIGDLTETRGFSEALRGAHVVYHTAAYFREYYGPGDHAALYRTNVEATLELARAALAAGVPRLIHTSSAAIVGNQPDGSPGDESTPPSALVRDNAYVQSKIALEPLLEAFAREQGLFVASVLPGWMWGPHDAGPTPSGQLVRDALRGKLPPAVPPGGAEVVDARDVAQAMIRIAARGRAGERYLVSQGFLSLLEIVKLLGAVTGRSAPSATLPYPVALAFASVAEAWAKLTGTASAISLPAIRMMHARLCFSNYKFRTQLGVTPRPFEETLRDTVEWTVRRLHSGSTERTVTGGPA